MHTRRTFLRTTGSIALLGGLAPFPLFAGAAPDIRPTRKGKTLVAVFLRGGIDGLNVIVPHGDRDYYQHRPSLAIARPSPGNRDTCIDLDGYFGLHPAADALMPMFKNGTARALQAVGYAKNTRSHFEEQDTWETGVVGNALSADGWLNRHLASSTGHGAIRAVAIGGNLPRILRGKAPAYAIRGIADLAMPAMGDADALRAALATAYCTEPDAAHQPLADLLAQTASATLEGTRQLEAIAKENYEPAHGANYSKAGIASQFREAARLIKAGLGTEVIQIDYGGWDTHNNQGTTNGGFPARLRDLAEAMAAFHTDLGDHMKDVLVLTLSDFGRTVRQNGTSGTDHGWANCMIALGGSLAKNDKPVLGEWPTLAPDNLHQGRDLKHTTDFRDVLAEAAANHLGNPNTAHIIPDHSFAKVGLI
jgi:uncharacterized protein (DUF1501 family)